MKVDRNISISISYPKIVEFTRSQPIRSGFIELLNFLQSEQIPLVVVSGGLQGMVESVMAPYLECNPI